MANNKTEEYNLKNYRIIKLNDMKNYFKLKMVFISFICCLGMAKAQESVNSSGGDAAGSGGSVSYSVGQLFYTNSGGGNNGSIAQGVQQAYEIYTLNLDEISEVTSMQLYPNPTQNRIILNIEDYQNEDMSYQIFDLQGRKISEGEIENQKTSINMSAYESSTYLIHVKDQHQKINQTFKIIKK